MWAKQLSILLHIAITPYSYSFHATTLRCAPSGLKSSNFLHARNKITSTKLDISTNTESAFTSTTTYAFENKDIDNLFKQNKEWVNNNNDNDNDKHSPKHNPSYLWIGSSDARIVPVNEIIGEDAGSVITVHNIGNIVCETDFALNSVLQYAVDVLKVPHIIVCGNYDCDGVRASMIKQDINILQSVTVTSSPLQHWLANIQHVYRIHSNELDAITDTEKRRNRLVELNVIEQCINLYKTATIQKRLIETNNAPNAPFNSPRIHAVAFDPANGKLRSLQDDFKKYIQNVNDIYDLYDTSNNDISMISSSSSSSSKEQIQTSTHNAYADKNSDIKNLFKQNEKWAKNKLVTNSNYFKELVSIHKPSYFWIGNSDARVSVNDIIGEEAGSVFMSNNIGNIVCNTDFSLNAALQHAVDVLKVPHVIICGNYDCGGVRASSNKIDLMAPLDNWLRNIRNVNRLHSTELNAIEDLEERHRRLVELNIIEQCLNAYKTSVVQRRRLDTYFDKETKMSTPRIHPIVFDPHTGIIKSLKDDFEENLRKLKKSYDVFDVSSYTPKK